ncbi:MAG: sigma-70 family RNA polymerase sigma factor [Chloroflexi bacterium]|nr:sigma-70 family RNA polymerase sigma factor [Chloroflexota bacterium]
MSRCAGGDAAALATLYDRHASGAYSVAVRITGNGRDAEDVVQDAFMGLWKRAASFDSGKASTRTWLFAIVHHRSVDCLRRRRGPSDSLDAEGTVPTGLQVADIATGVLDRLEGEHLWNAVRQLSAVQRQAIELAFGRGLSHQEVADVTGVPLGTAKSRVRLGLARLRAGLEQAAGSAPA